jgi:hypothetical protein
MKTRLKPLLLATFAIAASLTFLTGCGAPVSRGVIGSQPVVLTPEEWNGRWRSEDSTFAVRVADAENGLLELAETEEKDGALHLSTVYLYVREEPNSAGLFFNRIDPANSDQTYTFGRMVRKNQSLVLWPARTEAMEQLIGRGAITGQATVRDKIKQVTVTGGFEALGRELAGVNGWLMLNLDEPAIYVRERGSY